MPFKLLRLVTAFAIALFSAPLVKTALEAEAHTLLGMLLGADDLKASPITCNSKM